MNAKELHEGADNRQASLKQTRPEQFDLGSRNERQAERQALGLGRTEEPVFHRQSTVGEIIQHWLGNKGRPTTRRVRQRFDKSQHAQPLSRRGIAQYGSLCTTLVSSTQAFHVDSCAQKHHFGLLQGGRREVGCLVRGLGVRGTPRQRPTGHSRLVALPTALHAVICQQKSHYLSRWRRNQTAAGLPWLRRP
jgi:hypothetical protein